MTEQSVALDEVVITGTPGGQALRELGNAVTTVNAAQVTEQGTVNNIQQLLNGRAPGVFVNPPTGNVGTGARIRIRGASSLSLSNEPLIYVDGVRVNAQAATGPTNQGFGSIIDLANQRHQPRRHRVDRSDQGPGCRDTLRHRSVERRHPDHHQEGTRG